ncbi:MAG: DUF4364 family protein [Clostridia bacterium]|nr:DUF4364 family protein [Clostridia bacterium]
MEINALTAGIVPGGLASTSEVKVLICYILKTIEQPISASALCELLNYEGIANAFEISDNIDYLEANGHIKCIAGNDYVITESGKEIADTLKTTVPRSIREKACRATMKMLSRMRNADETDIAITREGDNTFITCSALENNAKIMSVKLLVSDESQAIAIKNNFINNPSEIYSKLIDLFTSSRS